jgi:cytochrome c2
MASFPGAAAIAASISLLAPYAAATGITRDQLVAASYRQGMLAFQQRCSACHALAEGSADLAGPALYGMFARPAGSKSSFGFSPALRAGGFTWTPDRVASYLANPCAAVPGTSMTLPEPVPEPDRIALISYLMLETGSADWPRPQPPRRGPRAAGTAAGGTDADIAARYPSFWNHLMSNTTRYRLRAGSEELRFDAYFGTDGSVASSDPRIRGFWRVNADDMFCYALYGLPITPRQLVECFPVVAMSIPRFREDLWTSQPAEGVSLTGGIVAGRPAAPGTAGAGTDPGARVPRPGSE